MSRLHHGRLVSLGLALVFPHWMGLSAQQLSVPLRSGAKVLSRQTTRDFVRQVSTSDSGLHGLAILRRAPSQDDRGILARQGVSLLSRLTRYAYLVRAQPRAGFADSGVTERVREFAALEPRDRVEPDIWNGELRRFRFRDAGGEERSVVVNPDSSLNLEVRFHDDVAAGDVAMLLSRGASNSRHTDDKRWRVTMTVGQMKRLAESDLVRWIDGVKPAGGVDIDKVRDQIGVNTLQTFNAATGVTTGLVGSGIRIGVYDDGIEATHADFQGALGTSRIVLDHASFSSHGTAMAGIIAGNGTQSALMDSWGTTNPGTPYQYRGIAPAAELIDAKRIYEVDPAAADLLRQHITSYSMDISNHSVWLTANGEYGPVNKLHDAMIRGDDAGDGAAMPARLHVHSAGNFGLKDVEPQQHQHGYFSLGSQLKNALVVGNYNSAKSKIATTSSMGPTHDGRIKPDVVAPGSFVMATGYCTISDNPRYFAVPLGPLLHPCDNAPGTMTTRGNFYYAQQGSSVGTAVVTGMLALVLQQMAEEGTNLDAAPPLPSTLRAIAIHSAHDIVASAAVPWPSTDEGYLVAPGRGPDFVTGFGLVNAVDAVDIVKGKLHREHVIGATCEKRTYSLFVGHTGPDSITVTLAWDDIAHDAGIAYDAPLLVNDLDLVLIDPMGQRHYPWSVDQQITDLAGLPLPDDAQVCGADIAVARTMKATANPIMFNDPIVNPVVPVVTGHDHLNNVEQVKTPAIMGKWTVEVSGFYVETGPQKFSLIGVPGGLMLPFPPQLTCKLFPEMCSGFLKNICLVVPTLCDRPHYIPIRRNVLTLRFRSVGDRNIMQLSSLCFALTEDGGCASDSSHSTPVREIVLGPAAAGFGVELVDVRGKIVLRDLSAAPVKRLRIPKESGDLFLVIRPGKTTRPGANYQVPIRLVRQE